MPLGWNTLDLPSFAMQHSKQFLARGPWRYHRFVSASDLHNSVDYSRPRHNLLRQREHRPDFKEGSEKIGVVHHRDALAVAETYVRDLLRGFSAIPTVPVVQRDRRPIGRLGVCIRARL